VINKSGASSLLHTLSGAPKEAFAGFPIPRDTAPFSTTFTGRHTVRSDDVTCDPRYARHPPHREMPGTLLACGLPASRD
jgi:hypothetical protein